MFRRSTRGFTSATQVDALPRAHAGGTPLSGCDDRDHGGLARRALRNNSGTGAPSSRPKETGSAAAPRRYYQDSGDVGVESVHGQEKGGQRQRTRVEGQSRGASDVAAGAREDDLFPSCLDSDGLEESLYNSSVQASRVASGGAVANRSDGEDSDAGSIVDRSRRSYEPMLPAAATPEVKGGSRGDSGVVGGDDGGWGGGVNSVETGRTQLSPVAERPNPPRLRHSRNIDTTVDVRRTGRDAQERREHMQTVMEEKDELSPGAREDEAGRGAREVSAVESGEQGSRGDEDEEDRAGLKIDCESVQASAATKSEEKRREEVRTRFRAREEAFVEAASGLSPGVGRGQGSSATHASAADVSNGSGVEFGNSGVWEHVQGEGAVAFIKIFSAFFILRPVFLYGLDSWLRFLRVAPWLPR